MPGNPQVDLSLDDSTRWRRETDALREILRKCGLTEELKWRRPCYAHGGRNICIIQDMKDFLALLFFKGALLKDPDGVLERQGPNSRSGFRMRFTSVEEVADMAETIRAYALEAIEVEKAGLKVEKARAADLVFPAELVARLDEDPGFKAAFHGLTPGRRRGYVLHFAGAKQATTRAARIERQRSRILDGKGLHDR